MTIWYYHLEKLLDVLSLSLDLHGPDDLLLWADVSVQDLCDLTPAQLQINFKLLWENMNIVWQVPGLNKTGYGIKLKILSIGWFGKLTLDFLVNGKLPQS